MRVIACLAVLAVAAPVHAADGFAELGGGIMIPAADNTWTKYVDPAPKLFVRGGATQNGFGGMLSLDWTPLNVDTSNWNGFLDVSAWRIRILANAVAHMRAGDKLEASARFGIGIDIQHVTVSTNAGPFSTKTDDDDSGLALEPAFGLWYNAGPVQLGGELALPISFHSYDSSNKVQLDDFTSFDVDILIGVRIGGGHR